ncbi:MAG: hypothetical protein M3Y89_13875 [Actinomycetota bacterium]|nr:hypothetical protein [Actinomycetota bacterium]
MRHARADSPLPGPVPFAKLRGGGWQTAPGAPTPEASRRAQHPTRGGPPTGSWPAHGALLDATAYVLAAPRDPRAAAIEAPSGGLRFSTPDTSPEAPNAGSHRRSGPSGLGNQVRILLATPTTVAAERQGVARIKPGQQEHLSAQVIALMPTPQAMLSSAGPDYARAARPGSGGDDLTTVLAKTMLLPTPTARDHKDANQRGDRSCLTGALLPTPRASDGTKGSPNQRGSSGDLTLSSAVHLLPTPTAGDSRSSAIQTVQQSGRPTPSGAVTLTDAVRLLPTPSVADALGGHLSRSGARAGELLLPGIARSLAAPPAGSDRRETPQ